MKLHELQVVKIVGHKVKLTQSYDWFSNKR